MNVDDPLAFFRAEDAEIARIRQEESLRRKRRLAKVWQLLARAPRVRIVVWVPSILLVALALIAVTVRHEFGIRNLRQRDVEQSAIGRFGNRGVSFDSASVIPGWQCATDDDGWRVIAVRYDACSTGLLISPSDELRNQLLAEADGDPYPVYTSHPELLPPTDAEIIAAFPYLRTINLKPVAH